MHPAHHTPPLDLTNLRMRDSELFAGLAFGVFVFCMIVLAACLS